MIYDAGKESERVATREWLGTKAGRQILQVACKGLSSTARQAAADKLMEMLVAGASLEDVTAKKAELIASFQ